jgi:hypothetical protein
MFAESATGAEHRQQRHGQGRAVHSQPVKPVAVERCDQGLVPPADPAERVWPSEDADQHLRAERPRLNHVHAFALTALVVVVALFVGMLAFSGVGPSPQRATQWRAVVLTVACGRRPQTAMMG